MNAQQLRNSILQMAIQGKLVPQDPNDEPASVLLERIRKEKEQLVKEGKLKKKDLATTPIAEEELPFEIPSNWYFCRLQDIAATIGGYAFKSEELKGNIGPRVIRISDVTLNGFCNKDVVRYNKELLLDQYEIHNSDILIAMTGGTVGKSLYVSTLPERLLLNQRVAIVRATNIYPLYLDLVIKAPLTQNIISERKNSTNDNISMADIKSFIIPLPPLAEQKRIVAKLEELLPLVEQYGKAQDNLDALNNDLPRRLRQSILQEAIQGKLVPQDPNDEPASVLLERIHKEKEQLVKEGKLKKTDLAITPVIEEDIPFELPSGWEWSHIEDITTPIGNKLNQIPTKEILEVGRYPVVSQGQKLIEGYTNKQETVISEYPVIMFGDHTRNVKYVDFPFAIGADGTKFFKVIGADSMYIYYTLMFIASRLRNRGYARHYTLLKQEYFPLPPLAEQKRIVAKIEELFKTIDNFNK